MAHKNQSNLLIAQLPLNVIDLFCGCGGFSLGMQRAGFQILAAIDFNAEAIKTYRQNLPHVPHILERDLTKFAAQELNEMIEHSRVDVIVGGPPCQGFSTVRQRDGANHGQKRLIDDKRRYLYQEFLRYVEHFRPRVFVMENVLGIRSAAGGEYFTRVQEEARQLGYRVHSQIEDAWELGVPQKRRRQLIIGVRTELPQYFLPKLLPAPKATPRILLGAAIGDLPRLRAGSGEDEREYDLERRVQHLTTYDANAKKYLFQVLEITRASKLTNHVARPHSERDLRDFALLREGENSASAMRERGVKFEFPYDKTSFKDRYTKQSRTAPCSTIVAHLSKDGLMFIHPTQSRSLTPREAARIQSFPDWFRFPTSRTHAYQMIGNAVPPLVAESIGLAVKNFLAKVENLDAQPVRRVKTSIDEQSGTFPMVGEEIEYSDQTKILPSSRKIAVDELKKAEGMTRHQLRRLPKQDFLHYWYALLFLFPNLHPSNALDHGEVENTWLDTHFIQSDQEAIRWYRYARSGWPLKLELVGQEAWRRYEDGEFTDEDIYCVAALKTGLTQVQGAVA